jgi:TRAP-type mannitol/chloroaromatic compound transport system permease small subunit
LSPPARPLAAGSTDPLLRLAYQIARAGVWFGGVLLIAAAVLVGVEVVIRKAFSLSMGGADELSGYALAISTSWALAFTLLERAHIRIDSLYVHLPVRVCALLDILGLVLLIAFFALVTWYGFGVFHTSYSLNAESLSPLSTPLVVPQLLWVLGFVMFLAIAVLLLVRALGALAAGDLATVRQLIGSRTVREEVAAEIGESPPGLDPRP